MTGQSSSPHRLALDDSRAIGLLAELLRSSKYTEPAIAEALKTSRSDSIARSEAPLLVRRLPERGALSALIKLFIIGLTLDPEVVARDCAPVTPGLLVSLGVVTEGPEGLVPRVHIHPFEGLFLASDPIFDDFAQVTSDYVTGLNPTTASVASITIRRSVESALDLGTGFGVQALLSARHCGRVVATDINPRALNMAAFNAALNGIRNIEFREGSLFEPVKGETFDMIVCNPPYVISPETGLIFRDSGAAGDALSRTIIRQAPAYLRDGGFATIRCNWSLRTGESGTDPVTAWVVGSGCDALIIHAHSEHALEYAGMWNRLYLPRWPAEFESRLIKWTDYFRSQGIDAIGTGSVVLRKRSGQGHWIRAERMPLLGDPDGGRLILRMFEAQDWIATNPDPLAAIFGPSMDIRVEQIATFEDGRFGLREVAFSFVSGLQLRVAIDPTTLSVLSSFDGSRTLGEILNR
ncbi:MAG TPA: class I SAM-dependent methyltransferase, partial [Planctomycetota bacterium]|nr:class I SAM-dependent methyltransferase [Planctomycetota bacterium]